MGWGLIDRAPLDRLAVLRNEQLPVVVPDHDAAELRVESRAPGNLLRERRLPCHAGVTTAMGVAHLAERPAFPVGIRISMQRCRVRPADQVRRTLAPPGRLDELVNITNYVIIFAVTGETLREARRERGWTQAELAARLGVTQAYVCLLERGRRNVPRRLAERLVKVLSLSPSTLPVSTNPNPLKADEAPTALGALGYPGFGYLRGRRQLNPAELLLRVLRAHEVDSRVVEALPWTLLKYPDLDWPWVLREAKANDLQNRLGFLLAIARELAELRGERATAQTLAAQERALEGSRLQREDTFRESMTDAERRWLHEHRSAQAAHWNMLSTMTASELASAY